MINGFIDKMPETLAAHSGYSRNIVANICNQNCVTFDVCKIIFPRPSVNLANMV